MITEANINARVHLDWEEIELAMLSIWGFSENQMAEVTGIELGRVKKIRVKLRAKLGGINSANMAFHAQLAGFKLTGTLDNEDIFSREKKRKILDIDPTISFSFPLTPKV